jgi:hypothetical protein
MLTRAGVTLGRREWSMEERDDEGKEREEERGREREGRETSWTLGLHCVLLPPSHLSLVIAWNVLSLFFLLLPHSPPSRQNPHFLDHHQQQQLLQNK